MIKQRVLSTLIFAAFFQAPVTHANDNTTGAKTAESATIVAVADSQTFTGKLAADHMLFTGGGSQLIGAAGWSVRRDGSLVVLDAPEGDTHIAVLDLPAAADAPGALKAARLRYRPDDTHGVKLIADSSTRDGWDETKTADYELSPNERAVLSAQVSRKGSSWNVVILDGSQQTVEKRSAAIGMMLKTTIPQGFQRETFAGRAPHELDAARIELLRSFLQESMKQLGVPGASFALMDHGKVVYEGGIGVRELGKPDLVNAHTLFLAASNTKGMSTLLLSTLADQGKLRWDQPVVELYPAFKLGSADVTGKVLVKHLVCACTGLPRQDMELIFGNKDATPETSFKLLASNSPTSGFGEVFQYNNLMAAAAGYIGAHLVYPDLKLGDAYDKAMQIRIFDPLGMKDTTFDFAKALKSDHASPYAADVDNHTRLVPMAPNYSVVPHRPAGGVWTSSHDLIRYVQLEANLGRLPDGTQMVSEENLLMRRKPQVTRGEDRSYGMGLMNELAWGIPVVYHGGSLFGYKSNIYLLPETGIGAVLLTNSDNGQMLLRPFMRRLLEVVYDGKPEAVDDVRVTVARMAKEMAEERKHLQIPADKNAIGKLATHYHSTELGDLNFRHKGRDVIVEAGGWQSEVATRKNDDGSLSIVTTTPGIEGFEFVVASLEGKRELILRDGQHEYKFIER